MSVREKSPLPPGAAAEPRCPFCMSESYYDLDEAARLDRGQGRALCLKHDPRCPRFRPCMACGADAVTGFYGLCHSCWDEFCCSSEES